MDPIIDISQLTMRFRRCHALRGVDLTIPAGTVFALLGENGAGKTTMIRILTGFQKPTSGTCRACGLDPTRDAQQIRRRIGYVSDSPPLYDWMTVSQIGGFAGSFYENLFWPTYEDLCKRYQIQMDQKVKHLSKGQRAKVALSLALAHDPELLIMDEPTSGLDPKVRRSFLESMIDRAATGRTVLLSSHQINEVERVADHIAILHQGKIRLVGALDTIRASIQQVTINLDDPLRTIPTFSSGAEVLSEERSGRSVQMYLQDSQPNDMAQLRDLSGVVSVNHRQATLEEIFVACTTDDGPSFGQHTKPYDEQELRDTETHDALWASSR